MPIVWHPRKWWHFCMTEDEKKKKKRKNRTNFSRVMFQCASVVYNMAVLKHFATEHYTERLDIV